MRWIAIFLSLGLCAFDGPIFQSSGTVSIPAGRIGAPAFVHNPKVPPGMWDAVPALVPEAKTLLVTDLFIESDPPDGAMLLILSAQAPGRGPQSVRSIQLRQPEGKFVTFKTPIAFPSGYRLNISIANASSAPQSVNWGVSGYLIDRVSPTDIGVAEDAGKKPVGWVDQPPID